MDNPLVKQPAADAASLDDSFEARFFTLLTRICRQLMLHAEQVKASGTLSAPQMWFLKRLHDAGAPQPVRFFADHLFSSMSNASQMLDRLESDGLVRRIANPRDRRSILVELTDDGALSLREAYDSHHALARKLLEPLSDEERSAALITLARILSLFEDDADDARPGKT